MSEELNLFDLQKLISLIRIDNGVLIKLGLEPDESQIKLLKKLTRLAAAKAASIGFNYPEEETEP